MAGIELKDQRINAEICDKLHTEKESCARCKKSKPLLDFFSDKKERFSKWCQLCRKKRSGWHTKYTSVPKNKRIQRVAKDGECSKCFHPWEGSCKTCTKCRNTSKKWRKTNKKKLLILNDGPLMEFAPESHQPGSEPRVDKPENQIVLELATTMENRIPDDESLAQMFICLNEDSQQPPSHPTDAVGDFSDYSFDLLNGLEDPDAVYPITEFDVNPIDVFVHDFGLHLVEQNVQLF